jgi:DNA-directed RNA polymerase subunit alpha
MIIRTKDFQMPKKLEADQETLTNTYGKFVAEPFERGFGITIGNSLRRVLLSSLVGAAITSVKIEGVLHEISSLSGVKEDITDVILNLKAVRLKLHGDRPKIIHLRKKGPGVVTAKELLLDADI